MPAECRLQRAEPIALAQAFDGCDVRAIGLHREHQARADRRAFDNDRARATYAVLAADMGACELQVMTQTIGKRCAWLDAASYALPLTRELRDLPLAHALSHRPGCAADVSARSVSTCRSARR